MRLFTDAMLGTLTTYLRFCGHDTAYALDEGIEDDDAILRRLSATDRVLLTRDRQLARRASESYLLETREVDAQLAELVDGGFDLEVPAEPSRCSVCNGSLERVDSTEQTPGYAPTAEDRAVWRCVDCGQHFWRGSHWDDMCETVRRIQS